MDAISVSTGRVRYLLKQIRDKRFDYQICAARDVIGPGGGVYITANTELDERHLAWLEQRNPAARADVYIDVVFCRAADPRSAPAPVQPDGLDLAEAGEPDDRDYQKRAEAASGEVASRAEHVARQAEAVYRAVSKPDFSVADLRRGEVESSLREFERRVRAFHGSVKKALDEYLSGNTLVMDLIVKFQLGKKAVRHALNVAAFATEMAVQLGLKQPEEEEGLETYFGRPSLDDLREALDVPSGAEATPEEREGLLMALFRRELVEIFLGGFMHDCGLWNEPFCLDEGHEVKGAKLIWDLKEVRAYAPSLVKIVLFHSDLVRLADRYGAVKVVESPNDAEMLTFKREFYRTRQDAETAVEMRPGEFLASVLTEGDLRKLLPVALAERYITQTQDITRKARWEVIGDLARYAGNGLYARYVVALCNSQIDVIAPRRAYTRLRGTVTVTVGDGRDSRRAQRLDATDFEAASLHHGPDRNSPHLITLFVRRPDGSRERAAFVSPQEPGLWDRSAGLDSRMYIPAGRFRNNLSWRVTGFVSEDLYARLLQDYQHELAARLR